MPLTPKSTLEERIAARIEALIDSSERTDREIAIELEIHEKTMRRWATERNGPRLVDAVRLCELFGVPITDLFAPRKKS